MDHGAVVGTVPMVAKCPASGVNMAASVHAICAVCQVNEVAWAEVSRSEMALRQVAMCEIGMSYVGVCEVALGKIGA